MTNTEKKTKSMQNKLNLRKEYESLCERLNKPHLSIETQNIIWLFIDQALKQHRDNLRDLLKSA